jgi:hypothetical protein
VLDGLGIEPRRKQENFLFLYRPEWFWDPPSLIFNGYWGFGWELKQQGRDVDHSLQSSVKEPFGTRIFFNFLAHPVCKM